MIPYKDENPTVSTPVITVALIIANVAAWVLLQGMGAEPVLEKSVCTLGLVPGHLFGSIPANASIALDKEHFCRIGGFPAWLTVLSSMFMHGGWAHLLGNMWFLWVFGNNVEDSTGKLRYLLFYLLCGAAAGLTQSIAKPSSAVPMVGASGAISGVMGAYVVLYPRVRVHMILPLGFYITTFVWPAWAMLGYWFVLQLVMGAVGFTQDLGGVAFLAHVGGFVAGMLLIFLFRNRGLVDRRLAHNLP
jgi:membrane associated rhomboid family serine protease